MEDNLKIWKATSKKYLKKKNVDLKKIWKKELDSKNIWKKEDDLKKIEEILKKN